MPPVHVYLQYGLCAHIAELDPTSTAMRKFSAIADAGTLKCVKIYVFIRVSSHADICLPCVCLAVVGGESFCRLHTEICSRRN